MGTLELSIILIIEVPCSIINVRSHAGGGILKVNVLTLAAAAVNILLVQPLTAI